MAETYVRLPVAGAVVVALVEMEGMVTDRDSSPVLVATVPCTAKGPLPVTAH
jgi:hypothetical protein